jgi:DNA modification methylase
MSNLQHGDCLDLLSSLPDNSIDMVLTDPPYQLNNWTNPMQWDKVLDLKAIWIEIERVSKFGAAICLFGNEPYSTTQRNSNPTLFKYDLIWVKNKITSPMLAKVKPLKSYEIISVFSTGKTSPGRDGNMNYYPQGLVKIDKTVSNNSKSRSVVSHRPSLKKTYVQEFTNYPKDVLFFDCESGLHPTQKPVKLLEYLISTYTLIGDTVLDFTIGFELDQTYFDIATKRITNA